MKILAIEDERIALEGLVSSIREAEPLAEIYSFKKAGEALAFFSENTCDVVFMDIRMRGMSGVELARQMRQIRPDVNIIFATGYEEYMKDAFAMHASGYLTKPVTPQKVRAELNNLRYPIALESTNRICFHTFGNFEAFVDGSPIKFRYDRTKEMLAYLVDRKGAFCNNAQIMAAIWQDEKHASYLSNLKKDLMDTLKELGCEDVLEVRWNGIRLVTERVDCDYYDWCQGKGYAGNHYRGEYMAQYGWAEFTNVELEKER